MEATINKYIIINNITNEVLQIMQWADNRDFPLDWKLESNEELITVDLSDTVEVNDMYDRNTNKFYVKDVTDNEQKKLEYTSELEELQFKLSDFQEETWKVLAIDETKLSQEWQDLLKRKRELRANILSVS